MISAIRMRRSGPGRLRLPSANSERPLSWWRELTFVAVVYTAYEFSRGVHQGGLTAAMTNGHRFLNWEDAWHLAPEHVLNQALHGVTFLAVVASYFYSTMHYIVTPAVLVWMYRKHADSYRFARTSLAVATVTGLVGFYLIPTAPPRLLAGSGLRDTLADVSRWGWWGDEGSVPKGLGGLSNQFAAMPSLHVGWAIWCGVLLARYATTRTVRILGWLYPIATSFVVMATGNHYLLDVFAGAIVMGIGALGAMLLQKLQHYVRSRRAMSVAVAAPHDTLSGAHDVLSVKPKAQRPSDPRPDRSSPANLNSDTSH
ncbi:MAG TPA: phosphatase PAP2 family protein [Jatrophihabitantaceae bacterium]|nr:phosphatase PAP2 family protein [Jatrophihabitantaceae bacterium]